MIFSFSVPASLPPPGSAGRAAFSSRVFSAFAEFNATHVDVEPQVWDPRQRFIARVMLRAYMVVPAVLAGEEI